MPVDNLTSQVPFVLTLASPAEVSGAGEVQLSAENIVGPVASEAAVEAAQAAADDAQIAADAAQATADEALESASLVWVMVGHFMLDISIVPTSIAVPAPVTGTLSRVMAISDMDPDEVVTVATSIGGVPVTNGAATIGTTEGGDVKSATPTAANAVTLGTSAVLVTPTSANTVTLQVSVMLGFTRA